MRAHRPHEHAGGEAATHVTEASVDDCRSPGEAVSTVARTPGSEGVNGQHEARLTPEEAKLQRLEKQVGPRLGGPHDMFAIPSLRGGGV